MSDSNTPPAAVPAPVYMTQPSALEMAQHRERDAIQRMHEQHDRARAASPKVRLKCVNGFTVVEDETPDGRVVNRGDVFEISEFDLPRFLGRGLPTDEELTPIPGR